MVSPVSLDVGREGAPGRFEKTSGRFGKVSRTVRESFRTFGKPSGRLGKTSERFGKTSGRLGKTSERFGQAPGRFGKTSGRFGKVPGRFGKAPESFGSKPKWLGTSEGLLKSKIEGEISPPTRRVGGDDGGRLTMARKVG
ncbi:MAG TPA: hypothetical protein VE078_16650 [Thermoanaerobaculia bacterium]|nr:hypothetical protein [Thermoanaerobaculia bacterium]